MGLDIYSGTLTRYYCHDWKTIVQQQCEEDGIDCEVVGPGGVRTSVEDQAGKDQTREIVTTWYDNLAASLDPPLTNPLWNESAECGCYTDKPDWLAFGALVLLQACQALNRPMPEYVEEDWDPYEEPVFKEAMAKRIPKSLISGGDFWFPIPRKSIFESVLPTGSEGKFSTVQLLRQELDDLNRQFWQADEATILSWRNEKYYVPVKMKEPKRLFGFLPWKSKRPKAIFRAEDLAQSAYSIMYEAVRFAEDNNVPIILDY